MFGSFVLEFTHIAIKKVSQNDGGEIVLLSQMPSLSNIYRITKMF